MIGSLVLPPEVGTVDTNPTLSVVTCSVGSFILRGPIRSSILLSSKAVFNGSSPFARTFNGSRVPASSINSSSNDAPRSSEMANAEL